ncbi:MAG: hypothetical protein ACKOZN_11610, partial [Cyanobium sp.]
MVESWFHPFQETPFVGVLSGPENAQDRRLHQGRDQMAVGTGPADGQQAIPRAGCCQGHHG